MMRARRKLLLATIVAVISPIALLIASPAILYRLRVSQLNSVCGLVATLGGTLSFDLQGDDCLHLEGRSASDESIQTLLPHLRSLPTGFTFIGPGEGRHFYVQLHDAKVSASGLTELCSLPISSLTVTECPNLHDDAVNAFLSLENRLAIIDGDIQLSTDTLLHLREMMPNAFPSRAK